MNITFLVGNGFDRNLGLDTTYSDFVKHYKDNTPQTDALIQFHNYIEDNEDLWSAAELAMGKYTKELNAGAAEAFSECHTDFCEHLSVYLKGQEKRIDYERNIDLILSAFSNINLIASSFPTQERAVIEDIIKKHNGENTIFNFICFNYTRTLDECLRYVDQSQEILGNHKNGTIVHNHRIGTIFHVHGTVEKEMVFGVNDDSQISKLDVFDCEDGDIYKNMLIKSQANASFLENTDNKSLNLLKNSHLIYVYGMSIGDTDKLWWDRICTWLNGSVDRHLIVHKYSMPAKSVVPVKYQIAERKAKHEITKHSALGNSTRANIENRIHITGENLFSKLKDIANPLKSGHPEGQNDLTITQAVAQLQEQYNAEIEYTKKYENEIAAAQKATKEIALLFK